VTTNRRTRRIAKAMNRVAMPLATAQLRNVIKTAHRRFDRAFAARIEADGQREAVRCLPGCAACCERAVLLTWAEADLLVAQHASVVAELLPELDRQNERLAELGAERAARSMQETSAQQDHAELVARWLSEREPCAFLDRTRKLCRVYESRPLACRAHVVTSAPESCAVRPDDAATLPRSAPFDEGPEYRDAQLSLMTATSEALGGTVLMGLLPSLVPRVFRDRKAGGHTVGV
jgi:Fe-S-cluster containining protein